MATDADNALFDSLTSPDTTVRNNYVTADPSVNPYANPALANVPPALIPADSSGMPTSDSTGAAPSNVDMADPDNTPHPAGFMSSIESFGSKIVSGTYGAVKTVATDVTGGVEGVAHKAVGGIEGAANTATMDVVIILAVVGVALVLIARSGAIKATF